MVVLSLTLKAQKYYVNVATNTKNIILVLLPILKTLRTWWWCHLNLKHKRKTRFWCCHQYWKTPKTPCYYVITNTQNTMVALSSTLKMPTISCWCCHQHSKHYIGVVTKIWNTNKKRKGVSRIKNTTLVITNLLNSDDLKKEKKLKNNVGEVCGGKDLETKILKS